jgi:hypothetical protein
VPSCLALRGQADLFDLAHVDVASDDAALDEWPEFDFLNAGFRNGREGMPKYDTDRLSDADVQALIAYMSTFNYRGGRPASG